MLASDWLKLVLMLEQFPESGETGFLECSYAIIMSSCQNNKKQKSSNKKFRECCEICTTSLNMLYNAILAVTLTSLEVEQAFSAAGLFIAKLSSP